MTSATAPTPAPTQEPKPANPEPLQQPIDPEKGRVKSPAPGKPEHALAVCAQEPGRGDEGQAGAPRAEAPGRTLQDLRRF